MKYRKFGASRHLVIENSCDLFDILRLDPSLWLSSSAYCSSYTIDSLFMEYLDADSDGRVIASDLLSVIKWLKETLNSYEGIDLCMETLKLSSINSVCPDYGYVRKALSQVMNIEGDNAEVHFSDVRNARLQFMGNNSVCCRGIIFPSFVPEGELRDFVTLLIKITGGEKLISGETGLSQGNISEFKRMASEYRLWHDKYFDSLKSAQIGFHALGKETEAFYELMLRLSPKIEQFFVQSQAYTYSLKLIQKSPEESMRSSEEFFFAETSNIEDFLKKAPLAYPQDSSSINISEESSINPIYLDDMKLLFKYASHVLGNKELHILTAEIWRELNLKMDEYKKWYDSAPCPQLSFIEHDLLERYLNGTYADEADALIVRNNHNIDLIHGLSALEKLILCQKNIIIFASNFVSFCNLYNPDKKALFEKGTLVIDGRRMNMSIAVSDIEAHKKIACNSNLFLLYAEVNPVVKPKYTVTVPVTAGVKGNLYRGKRGVFIDINGNMSDAVILDIIENPISLKETLIYPFKKIGSIFAGRFDSLSKESDDEITHVTTDALTPKKFTEFKRGGEINATTLSPFALLMGGGVALAALGSSITYIVSKLESISFWKIIITLGVLFIILLLPAVISSYIKLRKRDLSSILEGSGWAVNARMSMTSKLCRLFTSRVKWPAK